MAGQRPERKQFPVQLGSGVLQETPTPVGVSGGLTRGQNIVYRRSGAWGTRPGSVIAYSSLATSTTTTLQSGIRWYRSQPTAATNLVVFDGSALYIGGDPPAVSLGIPAPTEMTLVTTLTQVGSNPVVFTPVHDPAANNGSSGDILVITGAGGNYAFGALALSVGGVFAANDVITITMVNGGTTVTVAYTVLVSDNANSITAQLQTLVNASAAVAPSTPFLAQSQIVTLSPSTAPLLNLYALTSGSAGNAYTAKITSTNGSFNGGPTTASNFAGGGAYSNGPLRFDGTTVSGLSAAVSQGHAGGFTGCVNWHNHLWFWGDPASPATVYATDINTAQGFQFMETNGGYLIGPGDGDPYVQNCVPCGNILYVFKSNNIYAITGYDFQAGEYQFNVQPAIRQTGIPAPNCVAQLRNALVFWTGSKFARLSPGAFDIEAIGQPIQLTSGQVSSSTQTLVRAVGGSFQVQTLLSGYITNPAAISLTNVALFAYDGGASGIGNVNNVAVYDDDASNILGQYAWTTWNFNTSYPVLNWIPFSGGYNTAQTRIEPQALYWLTSNSLTPQVMQLGYFAATEAASGIPITAITGWVTCGTPALSKLLHQLYLEVVATSGVQIQVIVIPSVYVGQAGATTNYVSQEQTFATTVDQLSNGQYQMLKVTFKPDVRANAFQFQFLTTPALTGQIEITSMTLDYTEEAFEP